jgi:hypothetical protein
VNTGIGERARLSPPLVVSGVIFALDAVVCLLLALIWVLPTVSTIYGGPPEEATSLASAALHLVFLAVLALWCPAAATLVLGVRTRVARMIGMWTAALLVVASAGLAAEGLGFDWDLDLGLWLYTPVIPLVLNLVVVALLITPRTPVRPPDQQQLIDLDVRSSY